MITNFKVPNFLCLEADLLAAEEAANKSSIKNVIKSQLGKLSVTRTPNVSFFICVMGAGSYVLIGP